MKYIKFIIVFIFLFISLNNIFATNEVMEKTSEGLKLNSMIDDLKGYVESSELSTSIDLKDISKDLMQGKEIGYSKIGQKILDIFSKEIVSAMKSAIAILIVIVIMGIFSSLELENDSQISKLVYLVIFIVVVTMLSSTYLTMIQTFKSTITILTSIMQTVTPFVMIVLVASGGIVSSSLIEPAILFIASLIGALINYIVIPFITISIVMNIVSGMGKSIRLGKLGNLFSKAGIWIVGVVFTLFIGIIGMQSSITTSVDSAVVKTTQAAISNFVPVVGKFVSDSLESIMGATEVIGKTAGVLGIIVMAMIAVIPIIKLLIIFIIHKVLAALSESIIEDKNIIKIIDSFAETYKVMIGIMIGVLTLFIMSTGVIIKIMNGIS